MAFLRVILTLMLLGTYIRELHANEAIYSFLFNMPGLYVTDGFGLAQQISNIHVGGSLQRQ